MSIKRRNQSFQGQVLNYSWCGSYRSVLGWICSKQVLVRSYIAIGESEQQFQYDRSFFLWMKTGAEFRS